MPNKISKRPELEIVAAVAAAGTLPDAPQGGTIPLTSLPLPTSGFYVGGAHPPVVADSYADLSATDVAQLIAETHTLFVGWWIDSTDGKVYVDAVNWFQSSSTAAAIGKVRGEIAIWDVARGEEIRL